MGRHGDVLGGQAKVFEQFFGGGSRLSELVFHANTLHRGRKMLTEKFGNCAAQTARDLAFFGSYYYPGLFNTGEDGLFVKRFDGGNMDTSA